MNLQKQWKIYKAILYIMVVIFSLSPCRVKETLLQVFDIPYHAPSNKMRTTLQQQYNCNNSIAQTTQLLAKGIVISKDYNKVKECSISSLSYVTFAENLELNQLKKAPEIQAKRGPPKYILFQQLKVDLV